MGDFNEWHPAAHALKRMPDGAWRAEISLNHGHHHYLFVIDGKGIITWSYLSPVAVNPGADGIVEALEALPG